MSRAAVERLDDLDALLRADRQVRDAARRDRRRGRSGARARGCARGDLRSSGANRPRNASRRALLAEHDVLGHGERLHEHEVLVHHADAARDRVARASETRRLAARIEISPASGGTGRRARSSAWSCPRRSRRAGRGSRRAAGRSHPVAGGHAGKALRDLPHLEGWGHQRSASRGYGWYPVIRCRRSARPSPRRPCPTACGTLPSQS